MQTNCSTLTDRKRYHMICWCSNKLATYHYLVTNAAIATYLHQYGFQSVDDSLSHSNMPSSPRFRNPHVAFERLIAHQAMCETIAQEMYLGALDEQDIPPPWSVRNPDLTKFPHRHQRRCIKNPVVIRPRWKTHQ